MLRLLLVFFMFVGCVGAGEINYEELRERLRLAKMEDKDNINNYAFDSYIKLMQNGDTGFKVLSDAWANDSIPENIWLDWSYDFRTRFAKSEYQNNLHEYEIYFIDRFKTDKVFAKAVLNKLMTDPFYNDGIFIGWFCDNKRYSYLGYSILKKKYPNIPDVNLEGEISSKEECVNKIKSYLQ